MRPRQISKTGLMRTASVGAQQPISSKIGNPQIIGPLCSLAWLAELDKLVEAINDPSYLIEDDIEIVPFETILLCQ
ncbi:hypothetical protein N7517_009427 [Penicillium concentricum]|uniref:Uncharacterized protein n=1 Tax=Penicillium concentricum TaxID=293559 RepID=A0A9W9UZ61_9EURO|nr:uncharacterized protein N7517_009427 [Penicillium concentricum]KAJ5360236.1 hypothetical protein N7517_009427 [Penicillium concentricum]